MGFMKVGYTTDAAYVHFYKCAARGDYDSNFFTDRVRVVTVATGTAAAGFVRTLGRVVNALCELAKIVFYSLASIVTLADREQTKRLQDHCNLFLLNGTTLALQPLQFAIHSVAIAVGIIHPKTGYRLMQAASKPLAFIAAKEKQIWQQYKIPTVYINLVHTLQNNISRLFKDAHWAVKMAMLTLVHEFPHALDSGLVAPLAFIEPFRLFNANPTSITEEQKQLIPILLLNGNYSHQATFLPLLYALKQSKNRRPVYTINVPPNSLCKTDYIKEKIEWIKKQYNKTEDTDFAIDMLGHSMGSGIIQVLSGEAKAFKINRAVTVGTPLSFAQKEAFTQVFDITGKNDLLAWTKSYLDEEHRKELDTGHLGLLFHQESLQAMKDFLER